MTVLASPESSPSVAGAEIYPWTGQLLAAAPAPFLAVTGAQTGVWVDLWVDLFEPD